MKTTWMPAATALALAACSSAPKPTFARGWIGGGFADVSRMPSPDPNRSWKEYFDTVVGMPEGAPGDTGALVVDAPAGSPVAAAGLAPGDLVLSADGAPVGGWLDLREHAESLAPGSRTHLAFWRGGATHDADVVVGRETYESAGTLRFALPLPLWGRLDLWPFDDGFDILGIVSWTWDHRRSDLDTPQLAYRRSLESDGAVDAPQQESWSVFVLPVGVSKGKRVLRQETVQ